MKTSFLKTTLAAACLWMGSAIAHADTYQLDPVHSFVIFKVSHLGISNTYGRFTSPAGTITLDDTDASKSAVALTVEAKNIDTGDAKRDEHLRGPDFFNAKQFAQITFKSTGVKKADGGLEVTGDLMLHGVTKSITVKLAAVGSGNDPWGHVRAGYETTLSLKRSDYGMNFMAGAVGDDITLTIAIEAIKQ